MIRRINKPKDYKEYKEIQGSKRPKIMDWLIQYDAYYRQLLKYRLIMNNICDATVLCLGARIGTECKAFQDVGCKPLGIDLNPSEDAFMTIKGDFHDLSKYKRDIVFTNSFDHALKIDKVIEEIKKVLPKGGLLIFEAELGVKEGGSFKEYEVLEWDYVQDLIELIESKGFTHILSHTFDRPNKGKHVIMRLQ